MNGKFFLSLIFAGLALPLTLGAAPRTLSQMKQAAAKALQQHPNTKKAAPQAGEMKVLKATDNYSIMGYAQGGGFAVVSADDLVPEVLGVSYAEYSEGRNANFQWWLDAVNQAVSYVVAHGVKMKVTKPDPDKYPTSVEPMLTTQWDQEAPYNNLCPVYSGSTRCLTGCVATALAQVLNYHQMPEHGLGKRTIYYNSQAVTANFANDFYDWEHMRNTYVEGDYTTEEADAVALLMRDCGVAVNMSYGGPSEGSGAYSTDAAEGVRQYFGFTDAQCVERDDYSEPAWMDMVYKELSENGPLYYGGADMQMGGHAFVLHGYNAQGMVYVNWGWSGDEDGYYNISLLNPSYYTFSYGQDMIVGITSDRHQKARSETVSIEEAGTLQQTIEALEGDDPISSLTVNGPLNQADLLYIRLMAGRDGAGEASEGVLRALDLSGATLPDDEMPDAIFRNCTKLRDVKLPRSLKRIGTEAFSGCMNLSRLRVPTTTLPTLGTKVFQDVSFESTILYVRSGMKTKFSQASQWRNFAKGNIQEFGSSVKVRNTIRKYGEPNPTFFYTTSGDPVEGTPELTCEATEQSPAGRYPITITRGTVVGDDVDFYDGYLVVQKVDATAQVGSYEREMHQPNPKFEIESYEGLLSFDEVPAWLVEPVITTEATEDSPVGKYAITVASGSAQSYNMTFVPGVLTVTVSTGVAGIKADVQAEQPVFTLDGRRLNGMPRKGGIYVKGGKKIVIK